MKITLLGLEFALENMGCQALAYSFANILEQASQSVNKDCEYIAFVCKSCNDITIPLSGKKVSLVKIEPKKYLFWKNLLRTFKESDLIVDFTGGDSFSDIYGMKRFLLATSIKIIAIKSKTPFMMGPQTYGPFNSICSRLLAKFVIKRSTWVFSRDELSCVRAQQLSGRRPELTTDVAFALPYFTNEITRSTKIRVGFNVSGLLWNGGYSNAKIELKTDYQEFCKKIIENLLRKEIYEIYLIPHVCGGNLEGEESDIFACNLVNKMFPDTICVPAFSSPMEAKGFISSMDIFVGARMHATIAAFSTNVATIPVSYSPKFEGLFGSLGYTHIVSVAEEFTENAIEKALAEIYDFERIREDVVAASSIANVNRDAFIKKMGTILEKL